MVDLTVKLETLTFKNPILAGPVLVNEYPEMLEKCLGYGVGGVITPTYTDQKENICRPRPYIVSPQSVFPDLDMFLTLAEFSAVPYEKALEKYVPSMRKLCTDAEVPLIVSILAPDDIKCATKLAADFASNADALELDMLHLDKKSALTIVESVKKEVGIPVIARVSTWMYNSKYIEGLMRAGIKSLSTYTQMPKGILVDAELEEPYAINWPCSIMFGKPMLQVSLASAANILCAYPEANLVALDHVLESEDIIQHLLMGCKATSVCYGIQRNGYKHIENIIEGLKAWMESKGYNEVEDFLGKAVKHVKEPLLSENPFKPPEEFGAEYMPIIDTSLCKPKECIRCEEFCLHEVFKVVPAETKVNITDENCYGCGICVSLCPEGAITLVNRCTEETVLERRGTCRTFVDRKK
jgi:dihydroorotate dehydrogenase/NAD-dependent dihydropyrimidine dehydrogenase PreA subunit